SNEPSSIVPFHVGFADPHCRFQGVWYEWRNADRRSWWCGGWWGWMYTGQIVLEVVAICQIDALTWISFISTPESNKVEEIVHVRHLPTKLSGLKYRKFKQPFFADRSYVANPARCQLSLAGNSSRGLEPHA